MDLPDTQYFLLVVPICLILIGGVFISAYYLFKAPKYLFWMGLGCILPSVALGAQSLMTNAQLTLTAPWIGILYLGGAWSVAHGMTIKAKAKTNSIASFTIVVLGVLSLFYFAYVDEQLWLRMMTINIVIICLEALAIPSVYFLFRQSSGLVKLLCFSYFLLFTYATLRTLAILFFLQNVDRIALSTSKWWMLMLAINVVISLWFAIVVVATTVKEFFIVLNEERMMDPLTKLYNRSGFFEKSSALFDDSTKGEVYVVMCDIDFFKRINDTWGHATGDQILCTIADIFKDNVRQDDIVARFGGEEFIILFRSLDELSSFYLVDRLRSQIENQIFVDNIRVTASFGVACIEDKDRLIKALELADKRLYNAKNNGRNQVNVS